MAARFRASFTGEGLGFVKPHSKHSCHQFAVKMHTGLLLPPFCSAKVVGFGFFCYVCVLCFFFLLISLHENRPWKAAELFHFLLMQVVPSLMSLSDDPTGHRMVSIEGDLANHPVPTPCHGLGAPHQLRLPRIPSNLDLNTSRDGAPTALGSLIQCLSIDAPIGMGYDQSLLTARSYWGTISTALGLGLAGNGADWVL